MLYRICVSTGLLSILLGTTLVFATVTPAEKKAKSFKLGAFESVSFQQTFDAKQRALAICVGKYKSFLGLYVYDAYGNCVAWDDLVKSSKGSSFVGMATAWFPAETGVHTVEVINFGAVAMTDECELSVK